MQTRFTMGPEVNSDPYHFGIIRDKLTHTLPTIVPEAVDELAMAFPQYIPEGTTEGQRTSQAYLGKVIDRNCAAEWVEVSIWRPMLEIVARVDNRGFVGAPLCEYSSGESIVSS